MVFRIYRNVDGRTTKKRKINTVYVLIVIKIKRMKKIKNKSRVHFIADRHRNNISIT